MKLTDNETRDINGYLEEDKPDEWGMSIGLLVDMRNIVDVSWQAE